MKKFFTIIFLFFALNAFTQITFEKTFGGANNDVGYSVQQTSDNGYIISGWTESFGAGNYDAYLIKTNATGDTLWTKFFGGLGWDDFYSAQETNDSGFIMVGGSESFSNGGYDVYLIKTDADGDTLWTKIIGGLDVDRGYSIQQTSDNGYIITGTTWSYGAGTYDVYLIKTNSDGDISWTKTFGGANGDYGNSVKQTNDGGYIITGMTENFGAGLEDVYLIKTDAIGDTLWTKTFGGIANDEGNSVQQTSDNGYIITGISYSFGTGYPNCYLIKTNAVGDTLWTRIFGGYGKSVQQTTDGGYIITGQINGDVYLIKTNAAGDSLWTKTFGGAGIDIGNSVQQTSDGGYIIAGQTESFGAGFYDVYLIKTNDNGTVTVNEKTIKQTTIEIFPNPTNDNI